MSRRRPPPLLPRSDLLAAVGSGSHSNTPRRGCPLRVYDHLFVTPSLNAAGPVGGQGGSGGDEEAASAALAAQDDDPQRYLDSTRLLTDRGHTRLAGVTCLQVGLNHPEDASAVDEIRWLCSEVMDRMPPISILIVPWGPVAEGSAAMESYHDKLRSAIPGGEEAAANRIRGYSYRYTFRNLTTGAPGPGPTPFLTDQVVESLVWMGSKGLACDITLDKVLKDQSVSVLTDVTQLITRVYEEQGGGGRTKFVLNHLGYPDYNAILSRPVRPFLNEYERRMSELALMPTVYIKYSGFLTRLPHDTALAAFEGYIGKAGAPQHPNAAYKDCKRALSAFLLPVLEAFGEERIMWASDWPFSKTNILGKDAGKEEHDKIWEFSYRLALEVLVDFGLPDEALDKIFCTNAEAFYGAA